MQHDVDEHGLRAQGFRLTRQRKLILDVLRSHQHHLTAEAIFAEVKRSYPAIDLATVYRTLNWLHNIGLLRKIDVGKERLEYEYAHATIHHHLICTTCGDETEIDNHVIAALCAHIFEHYGFEADTPHTAIFGRCAKCRTSTHV